MENLARTLTVSLDFYTSCMAPYGRSQMSSGILIAASSVADTLDYFQQIKHKQQGSRPGHSFHWIAPCD